MRLQPNPPRLITVGIALAIGAIGLVYAWPIDSLVPILDPLTDLLARSGWRWTASSRTCACSPVRACSWSARCCRGSDQVMRSNYAPTARTIIVALVLILVGLLGTYGTVLSDTIGIIAFVAATAILVIGMVFRQI